MKKHKLKFFKNEKNKWQWKFENYRGELSGLGPDYFDTYRECISHFEEFIHHLFNFTEDVEVEIEGETGASLWHYVSMSVHTGGDVYKKSNEK